MAKMWSRVSGLFATESGHNRFSSPEEGLSQDDVFQSFRTGVGASSSASEAYGMESLIPIMNELHGIFRELRKSDYEGDLDIQLPQIVVVGDQSSGKSSVLESLVGKPFLPRGQGLVTRCPIVLELHHSTEAAYCTFGHEEDEKFKINEVCHEIERRTKILAGVENNIVDDEIVLSVYSPNVLTLTVVDMPGLVKNQAKGQPANIVEQINTLVGKYITSENSIILAVAQATSDLVTAESLRFAKQFDSKRNRTIVVVTMLDMVDPKKIDSVLSGDGVEVKLGIVGVINRSQADIDSGKTIKEALRFEEKYLRREFRECPERAELHGIKYLRNRLSNVLTDHIDKRLPEIEREIQEEIRVVEGKLIQHGEGTLVKDKTSILIELITTFQSNYEKAINGNRKVVQGTRTGLYGGASIRQHSRQILRTGFRRLGFPNHEDDEIKTTARNAAGLKACIDRQDALALVESDIRKLEHVVLGCADSIFDTVRNVVYDCYIADMRRYTKLDRRFKDIVEKLLSESFKNFERHLQEFIAVEAEFIDVDHEEFVEKIRELEEEERDPDSDVNLNNRMDNLFPTAPPCHSKVLNIGTEATDDLEQIYCERTKKRITIYFDIVLKNLKHYFRSALGKYVIYHLMNNFTPELMTMFNRNESVEELMEESDEMAKKREKIRNKLQVFKKAADILARNRRDINLTFRSSATHSLTYCAPN